MSLVPWDLTGLVTVLHTMEERASVSTHLARDTRTLHRFDRLKWKATSIIGSHVQVLLQSRFHPCRILPVFDLDGKFILDSGATMSMGGVDLLKRIQEMYSQAGRRFSSHRVTTSFFLRERTRGRVDKCFACTVFALESLVASSTSYCLDNSWSDTGSAQGPREEEEGQRWGFRSGRRFAPCLRGGGRGKFSAGPQGTGAGCRSTSR